MDIDKLMVKMCQAVARESENEIDTLIERLYDLTAICERAANALNQLKAAQIELEQVQNG